MAISTKKRKVVKGGTFGYEEKNKVKLCRELADIFEQLHGDKIHINNGSYGNSINEYDHDGKPTYNISIQKTANRSTKTSLEDSLSHILTKSARKSFTNKKDEINNFAQENHKNKIGIMSETIFDAFENKRSESWSAAIYKGYKERVTESNKLDGEKLITEIKDPVEALNAARLGLTEMVANSEFPEANDFIKSVERTMPKASVLLTNDYVQRVLKPWYQKITHQDDPENKPEDEEGQEEEGEEQGEGGQGNGQGEGEQEGEGQPDPNEPKWKSQPVSEAQKRYIQKLGGNPNAPKTKGQAHELIEKLLNGEDTEEEETGNSNGKVEDTEAEDKIDEATRNSLRSLLANDTGDGCDPTVDFENDTIEDQQEQGEEEIEQIENKLSEITNDEPVKKYNIQDKIDHAVGHSITNQKLPEPYDVKFNKTTVNRLKQLFKRIKSKQSQELADSGSDIDVDQYIRNQVEGGHEFLLSDVEQKGFAVVIGVDESGSMGNGNIESARELCATLYKAFDGMPNVDIYVFGWTTGYDDATGKSGVIMKKITKFSEVGSLRATGGTPFLEATFYLADFVEKLPHSKKLMFQITDGDIYHDQTLAHYFAKLRKAKIDVTGIQISYSKSQSMIDLFGKTNYIQTQSMDRINGAMTKTIVSKFMRCMK